jgi:hypothetical protein
VIFWGEKKKSHVQYFKVELRWRNFSLWSIEFGVCQSEISTLSRVIFVKNSILTVVVEFENVNAAECKIVDFQKLNELFFCRKVSPSTSHRRHTHRNGVKNVKAMPTVKTNSSAIKKAINYLDDAANKRRKCFVIWLQR